MKTVIIDSLSQYVQEIMELNDYYFRGEARDFEESRNLASGYRWMNTNQNNFYDLLNLRNNFYQEVGYNLSERDIENFISYSQHHGLPTELLDVSGNPLVALFFACECDENIENDGFVYALDKNNTVNLERSLIKEDISEQFYNFEENVLEKFDMSFIQIYEHFLDFFDEKRILTYIRDFYPGDEDYFLQIEKRHNSWMNLDDVSDSFSYKQISSNIKRTNDINEIMKDLITKTDDEINNFFDKNRVWEDELPNFIKETFPEKNDLKYYLITTAFRICRDENVEFPPMKQLIHQPSVIFDRMVNQQGKFIYQNHLISEDGSMKIQKYLADKIFTIPAAMKQKILKELDKIGMNLKFIYPDPDNTAKYITQKFNE